jgi:hypothetical protein
MAAALAEGQTAIQVLHAQATGSSKDSSTAHADLKQLATEATAAASSSSLSD